MLTIIYRYDYIIYYKGGGGYSIYYYIIYIQYVNSYCAYYMCGYNCDGKGRKGEMGGEGKEEARGGCELY